MRIFIYFLSIIFAVCIAADAFSQPLNENTKKFEKVVDYIDKFYVDTVNQSKLVDYAIIEVLKRLDPHSIYIGKDEVNQVNEPLEGSFDGIGIEYNIMNDTMWVISPIAGGPSQKAGILPGDKIIRIDGKNVAGTGLKTTEVVKLLRGPRATKVNLLVKRRTEKQLLDFTIPRDKIPIYSIEGSYLVEKNIGYIKLTRFSATTMGEFRKAFEKLKKEGMKKLILDLQDNSGGYLNTAVELADQFLDENRLIVFTEGINNPKFEYKATSSGLFRKGELVILTDENSASASEIISGAIQDWDRGLIIGRRTFGKGLVQRPFNLPDGSIIRLTVAKYYTPTGRLIQKPYKNGSAEYSKDLINRYNNGELTKADSTHFPDSLRKETLIFKRNVFGGGGIMPDIFVPYDTSFYSEWYRQVSRKNIIYKFVLTYMDNHREELKKSYPDFKTFNEKFIVTDDMFLSLVDEAEKGLVKKNEKDVTASKEYVMQIIKAYIAGDMFTNTEKLQILNQKSPEFNKALEVLRDKTIYNKKLSTVKF